MTYCEKLAESGNISAWKKTDKNARSAMYSIVVSDSRDYAVKVIPAARTTWGKAYKSALKEYGGKTQDEPKRKI